MGGVMAWLQTVGVVIFVILLWEGLGFILSRECSVFDTMIDRITELVKNQ